MLIWKQIEAVGNFVTYIHKPYVNKVYCSVFQTEGYNILTAF